MRVFYLKKWRIVDPLFKVSVQKIRRFPEDSGLQNQLPPAFANIPYEFSHKFDFLNQFFMSKSLKH
jgi:hypothetical protein